jgi:hypothetical protein
MIRKAKVGVWLGIATLLMGGVSEVVAQGQSWQVLLQPDQQAFVLPTTVAQIQAKVGRRYTQAIRPDTLLDVNPWGTQYIWRFADGLSVTAQSDDITHPPGEPTAVRAVYLNAPPTRKVPCLLGLVMNQTTKAACRNRFGKRFKGPLGAVAGAYQLQGVGAYTYLFFDEKDILNEIQQTLVDLATAN